MERADGARLRYALAPPTWLLPIEADLFFQGPLAVLEFGDIRTDRQDAGDVVLAIEYRHDADKKRPSAKVRRPELVIGYWLAGCNDLPNQSLYGSCDIRAHDLTQGLSDDVLCVDAEAFRQLLVNEYIAPLAIP